MNCLAMNYFEILVWPGGGGIGVLLWLLSFVLVAIIIQNILAIRRQNVVPMGVDQQIRAFLEGKQYREAIEMTTKGQDYLSFIMHAALIEAAHGFGAMERAMGEAAEERTAKMLRYTEWLNLIGNLGPMMGLLGTVFGMIRIFDVIGSKGAVGHIRDLAGGIAEALLTTAFGLIVAIPLLFLFEYFRRKAERLVRQIGPMAGDLVRTVIAQNHTRPGEQAEMHTEPANAPGD